MSSADRNGNSAAAEGGALHAVSTELGQLRRGELSLEQYVEARVDVATRHLRGRVSKERLEMVREVVRKALSTDPISQQFIRQLTRSDER